MGVMAVCTAAGILKPKREIITGKYKGKFVVVINGKETAYDITGKQDQIQIYWPPHKPGQSRICGRSSAP